MFQLVTHFNMCAVLVTESSVLYTFCCWLVVKASEYLNVLNLLVFIMHVICSLQDQANLLAECPFLLHHECSNSSVCRLYATIPDTSWIFCSDLCDDECIPELFIIISNPFHVSGQTYLLSAFFQSSMEYFLFCKTVFISACCLSGENLRTSWQIHFQF